VAPEGGACIAALKQLRRSGFLKETTASLYTTPAPATNTWRPGRNTTRERNHKKHKRHEVDTILLSLCLLCLLCFLWFLPFVKRTTSIQAGSQQRARDGFMWVRCPDSCEHAAITSGF